MATSWHRDPVFEEVAWREEQDQRREAIAADRAMRLAERRADPYYRAYRRRKISRLVRQKLR